MDTDNKRALPKGTELDGKYVIDGVLGTGGFGIVYRARHRHLDTEVAIKEYLPNEIAVREDFTVHPQSSRDADDYQAGLERFVREAKQLVRFSEHNNIVRCQNFFEANGTAYLVMHFEDGMPLSELIRGREQQGRPMTQDELLTLLRPLLSGLAYVHAHDVLHRDIKPGNIFIRRADEQPVLLDFGAAKQDFSRHSKSRSAHTPGYAALEQVEDEGALGPWTDIYAIGAVMWRVMTGREPPKVENRMMASYRQLPDPAAVTPEQLPPGYSPAFIELVKCCMALNEQQRPQSVSQLLEMIEQLAEARQSRAKEETATKSTPFFTIHDGPRQGDSLRGDLQLNQSLALKGGATQVTLSIPQYEYDEPSSVYGEAGYAGRLVGEEKRTFKVAVPSGTRHGDTLRLKGQGCPSRNGGEPGDLLLKVILLEDESADKQAPGLSGKGFLRKLIDGDYGLARTYWVYGVLVGLLFNPVYAVIDQVIEGTDVQIAAFGLVLTVQIIYSVLLLIGLWRAAKRYQGRAIWARLVQLLVVVSTAALAVGVVVAAIFIGQFVSKPWSNSWAVRGSVPIEVPHTQPSWVTAEIHRYPGSGDFEQAVKIWYWYADDENKAYAFYAKAAAEGHPLAKAEMAKLQWLGSGVEKDQARAQQLVAEVMPLIEEEAAKGSPHALYLLGWFSDKGLSDNASPLRTHAYYERAVQAGSPAAMNNLAILLNAGSSVVKQNKEEAAALMILAAKQGSPISISNLALYFRKGAGVEQNVDEALRLYGIAANMGVAEAMYSLGQMYRNEPGVRQDYGMARKYLGDAIEAGYVPAINLLGMMHENGEGGDRNLTRAVSLYRQAAAAGNTAAQENLRRLGQ